MSAVPSSVISPQTTPAILPGATLGVLGGGQLGRMFVQAAQAMGYGAVVLDPDPGSPAGLISHQQIQTDYDDAQGLEELVRLCAAVTTEFENVPADSLSLLARSVVVAPAANAVAIAQDRAREKAHFTGCGVACAPFAEITNAAQLAAVSPNLLPGILKTSRLGYDGKGQVRVATQEALAAAWRQLNGQPCVLEKMLPLDFECSVIVGRGRDGQCVNLPVQRNIHRDGILAVTEVHAQNIDQILAQKAIDASKKIASDLAYVGVLCVEFFVLTDGQLVVNEIAPRPHNSGHYSLDACDLSQFELQVRTLAGLPLVQPQLHSSAVMLNLLGDLWGNGEPNWSAVLALPGVHLHLYGKIGARPGRKMGHVTITASSPAQAKEVALQVAAVLGLPGY